ncbi:MAG: glycosyltransferase family 2 protein [Thermodesulfovibrionales bacterium]|nr:glycosyltransferase family 2 protein [Thermodesulfovibrionales bacterium]
MLEDSISSYLANGYPDFSVVVIDNGSTDGSKEYVERNYPEVKVLRTDVNLKYSGGFNFGMQYAFNEKKADYVLVTNNDVKADKNVIKELVKVAESDPQIGFVTGKVYFYDRPDTLQTVGKSEDPIRWNGDHIGNREKDVGQYEQVAERIFTDDIFTLVRRSVYKKVGGYNTAFAFQAEEYDWQARAKKMGFKIYYTPLAKIWHKESMTIGKNSAFKAYYDARNPMLVILLHKPVDYFRRYVRHHFYRSVLRSSLVNLKQLHPLVSFAIWRGFFSGIAWGIKNNKFSIRHFI